MNRMTIAAALTLFASATSAQSPYAGMQTRSIKAFSEQQLADLRGPVEEWAWPYQPS